MMLACEINGREVDFRRHAAATRCVCRVLVGGLSALIVHRLSVRTTHAMIDQQAEPPGHEEPYGQLAKDDRGHFHTL